MAVSDSLQLSLGLGIFRNHERSKRFRGVKARGRLCLLSSNLSSTTPHHCSWSSNVSKRIHRRVCNIPGRKHRFRCQCFLNLGPSLDASTVKNATLILARSFNHFRGSPVVIKLASAVGIVVFAMWGLKPLVRVSRNIFLLKADNSWKRSSTFHVTTSYIQPLLLWAGAVFICRALDPIILPTETSQIVKHRLLNFVRSLSTVLAFAYCLSSVIQQAQSFFTETNDPADTRNMGFQFAGRAVYTAVWIAAISLFMELLGFSTQKWLTAGGLGTVLLTLAGREIFTNFLSSAMIHATRPFVVNEWIQTKIEGYEVSGTVEHVGWWSPTVVRGDDREAVHIPNHKFTVNVVRNLSQKTHWRIKTHLAISHLDVSKINNIIADMRKVLAKNPQVEQQKLHRRVFLDNINPENQALLILVSCFVKTSHFEEYLCVKEAVLLDLLRVIRHHRARLATPIRTVQKIFNTDADLDNIPFAETAFNQEAASNRPLLLIEPSYKINSEDKTKTQARPSRVNGEEDGKASPKSTFTDTKVDAKGEPTASPDSKSGEAESTENKTKERPMSDAKADTEPNNSVPKNDANSVEEMSSSVLNCNASSNASSNKPAKKVGQERSTSASSTDAGIKRSEFESVSSSTSQVKLEDVRQQVPQPNTVKPSLEENIVLGVALEGSKRTLPIEEDEVYLSNPEDMKELATLRSGGGPAVAEKENIDMKRSNSLDAAVGDQSDQQG